MDQGSQGFGYTKGVCKGRCAKKGERVVVPIKGISEAYSWVKEFKHHVLQNTSEGSFHTQLSAGTMLECMCGSSTALGTAT